MSRAGLMSPHHMTVERLIMNENETRKALEAVRRNANDPTVTVGDVIFCGGVYATVTEVREWTPGTHDASPIRNDWVAVQVVTDTGARWRGVEPVAPQSGYTPCACRDCMDVAMSSDTSKPELCSECKDAGCEPCPEQRLGTECSWRHTHECQRDDAYEEAPECEGHYDTDDALMSGVGIGEPIYCDGSCVSR